METALAAQPVGVFELLPIAGEMQPDGALGPILLQRESTRSLLCRQGKIISRPEDFKQRGRFFSKRLYKLRARIEQTIGKL